jgi:hypothetical protein
MMIGASFLRAASRHALIPDDDTQFTAGIAYPAHTQHDQEKNGPLMTSEEEKKVWCESLTQLYLKPGVDNSPRVFASSSKSTKA